MGAKLSGFDVITRVGDLQAQFDEVSISIEDNSKSAKSRGRPNGHTRGSVAASGELTCDSANFAVLLDAAKAAGSWQEMPTFDVNFVAAVAGQELNIEAFECLIKIADLLSADANGDDMLTHKLAFEVTGKDFVRINGVPYAPEKDKDYLL